MRSHDTLLSSWTCRFQMFARWDLDPLSFLSLSVLIKDPVARRVGLRLARKLAIQQGDVGRVRWLAFVCWFMTWRLTGLCLISRQSDEAWS